MADHHTAGQANRDGLNANDTTDEDVSGKHEFKEDERPALSSLESLPAELRAQILLNTPDLPTLRSLVRASPVMHAQYYYDRDKILAACLSREMDCYLIEAYVASIAQPCESSPQFWREAAHSFRFYYINTSGAHFYDSETLSFPNPNTMDPDRIRSMAGYHISVVRPLGRLYSSWALANMKKTVSLSKGQQRAVTGKEVQKESAAQDDVNTKLNRNEEIRIFRALYWYEVYYNVIMAQHKRECRNNDFANELFYDIWTPWDAQAIACIQAFFRSKFREIFDQVQPDLQLRNPNLCLVNGYEFAQDFEDSHVSYKNGLQHDPMPGGLKMVLQMFTREDHSKLVTDIERSTTHFWWINNALRGALINCRKDTGGHWPNYVFDMWDIYPLTMCFAGDNKPPIGPPFAWTVLWEDQGVRKTSNMGCFEDSLQRLIEWGYVMWDECRLTNMGADKLLWPARGRHYDLWLAWAEWS